MRIVYNKERDAYIVQGAESVYREIDQALPTCRVLDGSLDHGYFAEYVGHGKVGDIPVRAVYLLDWDQADIEDEGDFDWDTALKNGRIEIDVNRLNYDAIDILRFVRW